MKLLNTKKPTNFIYQIGFLFLFLFGCNIQGQAGIIYPTNDSTVQKVIEFTHVKKSRKSFFKKGDQVVIYTKDKEIVKDSIQGFTEDGIIIDGKEISIQDINLIRGKSVAAFIFSIFSRVSLFGGLLLIVPLVIVGLILVDLLDDAETLLELLLVFLYGLALMLAIITLISILFGLGIVFLLASQLSRRNTSFSLRKKWAAKIISKKLPV